MSGGSSPCEAAHFLLELVDDIERAAVGLAADHDQDRIRLAVGGDDRWTGRLGGRGDRTARRNRGNADADAILIHGHDEILDLRRCRARGHRPASDRACPFLRAARRTRPGCFSSARRRPAVSARLLAASFKRIGDDVKFRLPPADQIDPRHARDAQEPRLDDVFRRPRSDLRQDRGLLVRLMPVIGKTENVRR